MSLTFIDLYNECAGQPWSMFDNDAESIEDFESSMKISINKAISDLWNLQNWSFRTSKYKIKTMPDKDYYAKPEGIIAQKTIKCSEKYYVKYNKTFLPYQSDYELLDEKSGEPESFYIDNDYIYIYPTPDKSYIVNIKYYKAPFGLTSDESEELYELVNDDDFINIPKKYEVYFKNCVISLAMIYAIADESDENYSGYKRQYDNALNVLISYCKNNVNDKDIVW